MHAINTTGFDYKREKSIEPRSNKMFWFTHAVFVDNLNLN